MLLWRPLHPTGSEVDSRRVSIGFWKVLLVMLPLSPPGSYFSGYPGRLRCRGAIFFFFLLCLFAVISRRGGSWVGNPIGTVFPRPSGNITPLIRPHTVPGVPNNGEEMTSHRGRSRRMAAGTTWQLTWSGEGGVVLGGRCGLSAQSERLGPQS